MPKLKVNIVLLLLCLVDVSIEVEILRVQGNDVFLRAVVVERLLPLLFVPVCCLMRLTR